MSKPRMITLSSLIMIGIFFASACSSANSTQSTATPKMETGAMPDFVQSAPPAVQTAYQFAFANPHALETVPCYCGCGRIGHKSNLNCYIKDIAADGTVTFDNHAAYCGICVNITDDVMRLQAQGKSPLDIRKYVDAQYSSYGPSTDTAIPTE